MTCSSGAHINFTGFNIYLIVTVWESSRMCHSRMFVDNFWIDVLLAFSESEYLFSKTILLFASFNSHSSRTCHFIILKCCVEKHKTWISLHLIFKIYLHTSLFEWQMREGERDTDRQRWLDVTFTGSLLNCPKLPGLDQAEAKSQNLHLGFPQGWHDQGTWAIFCSWIGSRTARAGISAHLGCWRHRDRFSWCTTTLPPPISYFSPHS